MRNIPDLLRERIGEELFEKVSADPAAFAELFDPEKPPWPYQADALREAATPKEEGEGFKYRTVCISTPRQNGKSVMSAQYAVWRFFTDPTCELVVSVCLDRPGALIVLNEGRRIIRGNEILNSLIDGQWGLTKWSIRLVDGSEWMIKSSEAALSRGYRPSLVCYDELGHSQDQGELLQILIAGQVAQARAQLFVTSTVSVTAAGPLWRIFERANEVDPDTLLVYHTENLSPLITAGTLAANKKALLPMEYLREHENKWSEGSDAFCTIEDVDKAMKPPTPLLEEFSGPAYLFADLSWRKDETVISVSRATEEGMEIVGMQVFTPTPEAGIDFDEVKAAIEDMAQRLGVREILIESPQAVGLSQQIKLPGAKVDVYHPTAPGQRGIWGAMYLGLRDGLIRLPKDRKLRRQLLSLTIRDSGTGWKVEEIDKRLHQDRAFACSGAIWMAQQAGISKWVSPTFLAITDAGPVKGPNLTPLRRTEFKDHLPGVRRRSGAPPISGAEVVLEAEDHEVDSLRPGRRLRVQQMAKTLLAEGTTLQKLPHLLSRQFSLSARQVKRVLSELYDE